MKAKKKEEGSNIKLGTLVVGVAVALIVGLYLIGDKQNLFGDTFVVSARFKDVGGLIPGNNVRFGGMNVGTVEEVVVMSDTNVLVIMRIDEKYHHNIHKNSLAILSTEGMMGNRIVSISSNGDGGPPIKESYMVNSMNAISMDETARTLSLTNQNLKEITDNVKSMTDKLDSSALWMVVKDTAIAENIRSASFSLSESMDAISNSFLIKGLQWKNGKKKEKQQKSD